MGYILSAVDRGARQVTPLPRFIRKTHGVVIVCKQKKGTIMLEQQPINVDAAVNQLYDDMHAHSLQPLWKLEEALMLPQPQPKVLPWLWKWESLFEIAKRSGRLV